MLFDLKCLSMRVLNISMEVLEVQRCLGANSNKSHSQRGWKRSDEFFTSEFQSMIYG